MKRECALVVGGGLSGLAAARVLSNHFESVVILEKDPRIGSNAPRTGAAQGAHLHVLLKRGQEILEELFPGIASRFTREKCPIIDWAADTEWETRLGAFPHHSSEITTHSFSRPLLESIVYSLVSASGNVSFKQMKVEKVSIKNNLITHVGCGDQSETAADLIVFAGGHHFPIKRLMPHIPIEEHTESVPIQITYRSVVFETNSLNFKDFKQYYYQFSPPQDSLGAVISPIENDRCVATIVEYGRSLSIKTDLTDFMKLAARVPGERFIRIIENGAPLTGVSVFHKPTMYRRRLHKISEFPENVLVMGDLFCSLNPVFGQGITVALEQALVLRSLLSKKKLSAKSFHCQSEKRVRLPFLLSKLGSNTEDGFAKRYLQNYMSGCRTSFERHQKFLKVLHLKASYGSLIDPSALLASVLNGGLND